MAVLIGQSEAEPVRRGVRGQGSAPGDQRTGHLLDPGHRGDGVVHEGGHRGAGRVGRARLEPGGGDVRRPPPCSPGRWLPGRASGCRVDRRGGVGEEEGHDDVREPGARASVAGWPAISAAANRAPSDSACCIHAAIRKGMGGAPGGTGLAAWRSRMTTPRCSSSSSGRSVPRRSWPPPGQHPTARAAAARGRNARPRHLPGDHRQGHRRQLPARLRRSHHTLTRGNSRPRRSARRHPRQARGDPRCRPAPGAVSAPLGGARLVMSP